MNSSVNLFINPKETSLLAFDYIKFQVCHYCFLTKRDIFDITLIITLTYINPAFYRFYTIILFFLYWLLLGIMSTIGLGFGLQTGILFVLPYVLTIYSYALECSNTDFDILGEEKYICKTDSIDPFLRFSVFIKCLPVVFIWGSGSALGELPPFLIAKYSENTSIRDIKGQFVMRQIERCIKKYRFFTILLFASWPNITFDMCGLMCGYYKLTLTEFLLPTFLGKVCIKSTIQLFLIVYFYSEEYTLQKDSYMSSLLNSIIIGVIFYFIKTFLETCAKKQYNIINKKN